MAHLRICLFGDVRISLQGLESESRAVPRLTRVTQALLAYLLIQRHSSHPRDVLASLFWGELSEERARSCLSTALWRLRQALEPQGIAHGTFLTATAQGEVGFNQNSDYWLDIDVFERQANAVLARPIEYLEAVDAEQLKATLRLSDRDILEGFYDDWALRERERLRRLHLNSLAHLMRYYRRLGAYEDSIQYGRQILAYDPLREEIHREVMRLYADSGQRAMAVQQYEACRNLLADELGILPMEETQGLLRRIISPADPASPPSPVRLAGMQDQAAWPEAYRQLQSAVGSLAEALRQLERAVEQIGRLAR